MACILKRRTLVVAGFIVACFFLVVLRLINEINFPLLRNCFEKPISRWIPFSYPQNRSLKTHYGYINVRTQEPLQLDCDLCAIISNSGQMSGQRVGNEIDQSSCVWRMNNAPTKGYEDDVGRRTTVRVVSHTSVPLLLKNPAYFFEATNSTLYVIWGPFRNMRMDGNGIVYNMLKKVVDRYTDAKIYVTTEKRMNYCDAVFKKETGKDRLLFMMSKRKYSAAQVREILKRDADSDGSESSDDATYSASEEAYQPSSGDKSDDDSHDSDGQRSGMNPRREEQSNTKRG